MIVYWHEWLALLPNKSIFSSISIWQEITALIALRMRTLDFPSSPVVKNLPANAGDMGSIPGLGRFHVPHTN